MEESGEEEEEEEEERNMENELLNGIMVEETRETDAAMGEGTCKAACAAQGTKAGEILSLSLSLKSGRRVCRKDLRRAGNCIGICREMKTISKREM